ANPNRNNVINLFPGCVYTLNAGALSVSSTITINGNGATIDGASSSRVFVVAATGNLTLTNLTVTRGRNTIGAGSYNEGTVKLNANTMVNGTTAVNIGLSTAKGGGIYNDGTLNLNANSSVSGNTAFTLSGGDGGGIFNSTGTVNLNANSSVTGNTASNGEGG